jgi:hypothetical protein
MSIVPIEQLLPVNLDMRGPLHQPEAPVGSAYLGQGVKDGIPALVHLSGVNTGQAAGRLLSDQPLHLTVVSSAAHPHTQAAPAGPKPVFSSPVRTELSGWEDIDFDFVTP